MVVRVRLGSTDACASSGYGLANETKATSVAKQSSGVWQSKKSNLLQDLEYKLEQNILRNIYKLKGTRKNRIINRKKICQAKKNAG